MRARPVVIAGAGIGGLTAALALAARGIACVVLEKSADLAPAGAGIQLSPNASRILIGLGLGGALAARATVPEAVILNSVRGGGGIARLPLMQSADAPYWVIHRADLQAVLRAAVEAHCAITLRLDAGVDDFGARGDAVDIVVAGGETLEAAALIGADGVGSRIRRRLFPGSAPQSFGRAAWRGFAPQPALPGPPDVQLWMGADAHLVAYPVANGQINLVVTLPNDNASHAAQAGGVIAARLAQAGWPKRPCGLIASADRFTPYPLHMVPDLPAWNIGHVALLGDAAHAMLPFAAQGAAMAIEDAAVLARSLAERPADIPAALARYSELRRPRVAQVARTARQSGRIYHMKGVMALARDSVIRMVGGRRLLDRQNWIYDWS